MGRARASAGVALLDEEPSLPDDGSVWESLGPRRARAEEFLAWVESHDGQFPLHTSTDARELSLAKWRRNQIARAPEDVLTALNAVIPGFTERRLNGHAISDHFDERLKELREWVDKNKRPPSMSSDDAAERSLAVWVSRRRQQLHDTQLAAVEEVISKVRNTASQRLVDLTAFVVQHGRMPAAASEDSAERSLYNFIREQRRKKTAAVPVIEGLKEKTRRQLAFAAVSTRADEFAKWVEKNGHYPRNASDDPYEALLGGWRISQLNKASKEILEFLEERIPGFTQRRTGPSEARFERRVQELTEWVARHKRRPNPRSDDAAERSLAAFIVTARYRGGPQRGEVVDKVLTDAGVPVPSRPRHQPAAR